ncbi:MAG: hypothetical protein IJP70_11810 [Bacteroidales bacterium]|nr:hypothetical protein [Bacteroidales bacterium]
MFRRLLTHFISENKIRELHFARHYYHWSLSEQRPKPMVISCFEGGNGFADRLRGIISAYAYAKCIGVPYCLEHTEPYLWENYFVPNHYDWRLKEDEKSYNLRYARPVFFMDDARGNHILELNPALQYHIYSNQSFLSLLKKTFNVQLKYHELYDELFRPSVRLQSQIDKVQSDLGCDYVSVSFRFQRLMGDFDDVIGRVLSESERVALIGKCRNFLCELKKKHPEVSRLLVTSDSSTFVKAISDFDFCYVIPGDVGHLGTAQHESVLLKTFLDFYMISRAKKVYMAHTGEMYRGGFAQSAAASTNTIYEEILF